MFKRPTTAPKVESSLRSPPGGTSTRRNPLTHRRHRTVTMSEDSEPCDVPLVLLSGPDATISGSSAEWETLTGYSSEEIRNEGFDILNGVRQHVSRENASMPSPSRNPARH